MRGHRAPPCILSVGGFCVRCGVCSAAWPVRPRSSCLQTCCGQAVVCVSATHRQRVLSPAHSAGLPSLGPPSRSVDMPAATHWLSLPSVSPGLCALARQGRAISMVCHCTKVNPELRPSLMGALRADWKLAAISCSRSPPEGLPLVPHGNVLNRALLGHTGCHGAWFLLNLLAHLVQRPQTVCHSSSRSLHCFCAHRHARTHTHAEQAVLLQF